MAKMSIQPPKPSKFKATSGPQMNAPGGGPPDSSGKAAAAMAAPKGPGGAGFLINPNMFSDSHAGPPSSRGQRKSQGYPSLQQNP